MGLFDRLFRRSDPSAQAPEPAPEDEQSRDLVLRVSNLQGIGRREGQEDSFALLNASDPEALVRRGLFAVVCDGMGGMEGGRGFLQLFQALNDEGDVPRQLREGTCALSDGLFQRFGGRSGTTAVAVRVFQNALHWISVGDSAMFLRRGGGVFQLNQEHTYLNVLYEQERRATRTPGGSPPLWASTAWRRWTRACAPCPCCPGTLSSCAPTASAASCPRRSCWRPCLWSQTRGAPCWRPWSGRRTCPNRTTTPGF